MCHGKIPYPRTNRTGIRDVRRPVPSKGGRQSHTSFTCPLRSRNRHRDQINFPGTERRRRSPSAACFVQLGRATVSPLLTATRLVRPRLIPPVRRGASRHPPPCETARTAYQLAWRGSRTSAYRTASCAGHLISPAGRSDTSVLGGEAGTAAERRCGGRHGGSGKASAACEERLERLLQPAQHRLLGGETPARQITSGAVPSPQFERLLVAAKGLALPLPGLDPLPRAGVVGPAKVREHVGHRGMLPGSIRSDICR